MTYDQFAKVLRDVERVARRHGARVDGIGGPESLADRARRLISAIRRVLEAPKPHHAANAVLRKQLNRLGDAAFDVVDKTSAAAEKAMHDVAWAAWQAAAPPLLWLAGLWALYQLAISR